jgi:hypothetical protein
MRRSFTAPTGLATGDLPWFVQPARLSLFLALAVLTLWIVTPTEAFETAARSTQIHSAAGLTFFIGVLGTFWLGTLVAARVVSVRRDPGIPAFNIPMRLVQRACVVGFLLSAGAYCIWFGLAATRAGGVAALFRIFGAQLTAGGVASFRFQYFETIAGVTTFTQVAPPTLVLAAIWIFFAPKGDRKRVPVAIMVTLLAATALRGVFLVERLSLLELLIPITVVAVVRHRQFFTRHSIGLPIAAFVFVYGLFTLSEMFRSWTFVRATSASLSLWEYSLGRLAAYYLSSVNNTNYLVDHGYGFATPFYFSMRWLWELPLYGDYLWNYELLTNINPAAVIASALAAGPLTREFNTFGAPGWLFLDFGWAALFFAALLGFASQTAFSLMASGRWYWLVVYPVWFTGITEFPRLLYWTSGRFFPALLFLFGLYCVRSLRRMNRSQNLPLGPAMTNIPAATFRRLSTRSLGAGSVPKESR